MMDQQDRWVLPVRQDQKEVQEVLGKWDKLDQLVCQAMQVKRVILELKDQQVALVQLDHQDLLDQQEVLVQEEKVEQEVILDYQDHRVSLCYLIYYYFVLEVSVTS